MNSVARSNPALGSSSSAAEPSAQTIVRTRALTKVFGDFSALDDCSLTVNRGEIFGLLGPNGAGKTTLIRLLLGYLRPTSGQCEIAGSDPQIDGVKVRRSVAYLPGDARLPRHMKADGVIRFFADMHPAGDEVRGIEIARRLELDRSRRVAFMSTGMRQKLALSVVLSLRTPVLILDEPTANLDPTVRGQVLDLVLEAQENGRTVLLSSHVLSEIEDTCDRVVFLRGGTLAKELQMKGLFQRHRISAAAEPNQEQPVAPESLADRVRIGRVDRSDRHFWRIDTSGDLSPVLHWIAELNLRDVRIEPLGLRSIYDEVHFGGSRNVRRSRRDQGAAS